MWATVYTLLGCKRSNLSCTKHMFRDKSARTGRSEAEASRHRGNRFHTRARKLQSLICARLQVSPSVYSGFCVGFPHTAGSLSLALCRHPVPTGLLRRRGQAHSACQLSLIVHISQCAFNEYMVIDLPSLDVVQEGDFNVHQE